MVVTIARPEADRVPPVLHLLSGNSRGSLAEPGELSALRLAPPVGSVPAAAHRTVQVGAGLGSLQRTDRLRAVDADTRAIRGRGPPPPGRDRPSGLGGTDGLPAASHCRDRRYRHPAPWPRASAARLRRQDRRHPQVRPLSGQCRQHGLESWRPSRLGLRPPKTVTAPGGLGSQLHLLRSRVARPSYQRKEDYLWNEIKERTSYEVPLNGAKP